MKIKCTQCGAEIPISEDSGFLVCPFCESSLYVELDQTVRHYSIDPLVKPDSLAPTIQRHLAKQELKRTVKVHSQELKYFPFWHLQLKSGERLTIPAYTTSIEHLSELAIPMGDLKFYAPSAEQQVEVIEPEILLDGARAYAESLKPNDPAVRSDLVHLPIYFVHYDYLELPYTAAVDAVAGNVYADELPPSPSKAKDSFFAIMAVLVFIVFFVEGLLIKHTGLAMLAYAGTALPLYFAIRAALQAKGW